MPGTMVIGELSVPDSVVFVDEENGYGETVRRDLFVFGAD